MKRLLIILALFVVFVSNVTQGQTVYEGTYNNLFNKKETPNFIVKLRSFFDDLAFNGKDTNYLALPKKRCIVKLSLYYSSIEAVSSFYVPNFSTLNTGLSNQDKYPKKLNYQLNSGDNLRLAIGGSYRGFGGSLSFALSNKFSSRFNFSVFGSGFGFEILYQKYKDIDTKITPLYNHDYEGDALEFKNDDVKVTQLYLSTYYNFNSKRFSYEAAQDGTMIQKKRVGSVLISASYNRIMIDTKNALIKTLYFRDIEMDNHQVSLGVGYTYNLPLLQSRLCLNATIIPMVTWGLSRSLPKISIDDFKKTWEAIYGVEISEQELAAHESYLKDVNDKIDDYNNEHKFTPATVFRMAGSYSFSDLVFTIRGNYYYYIANQNDDFGMATYNYNVDFVVSYRF